MLLRIGYKMPKNPLLSEAYIRFTKFMEAVEKAPGFPLLDEVEKKLLQKIAVQENSNIPVLVGDLVFSNPAGSPATINRRLANLQKKKLIKYVSDDDGRKRYIRLTQKSKSYFNKLGELIVLASRN
jgi:hypothetical protein